MVEMVFVLPLLLADRVRDRRVRPDVQPLADAQQRSARGRARGCRAIAGSSVRRTDERREPGEGSGRRLREGGDIPWYRTTSNRGHGGRVGARGTELKVMPRIRSSSTSRSARDPQHDDPRLRVHDAQRIGLAREPIEPSEVAMQNQRAILFLILAVALGVGAAFTAQRWLEQQRQQPTGEQAHHAAGRRDARAAPGGSGRPRARARDRGLAARLSARRAPTRIPRSSRAAWCAGRSRRASPCSRRRCCPRALARAWPR